MNGDIIMNNTSYKMRYVCFIQEDILETYTGKILYISKMTLETFVWNMSPCV